MLQMCIYLYIQYIDAKCTKCKIHKKMQNATKDNEVHGKMGDLEQCSKPVRTCLNEKSVWLGKTETNNRFTIYEIYQNLQNHRFR